MRAFDAAGDRAREHGLRRAGDVLEEHVAAADERREHELDLVRLAVDHGLDVLDEARRASGGAVEALAGLDRRHAARLRPTGGRAIPRVHRVRRRLL
jgi:hypothetical protein